MLNVLLFSGLRLLTLQDGPALQEGPSGKVELVRKDEENVSHCELVVDGTIVWTVDTPRIEKCDYNVSGYLAATASTQLRYGLNEAQAIALIIVNSKGKLVLFEAVKPIDRLPPHSTTYPIILGVSAMDNAAVFRLVPGPGLGEQWRVYSSDTGAPLRPIDPTEAIKRAFDAERHRNMTISCVSPLHDAKAFVVLAAPAGVMLRRKIENGEGFGGTVIALIDLRGQIIWKRESFFGTHYGVPSIRKETNRSYQVRADLVGGGSNAINVLRVKRTDQGTLEAEVLGWD